MLSGKVDGIMSCKQLKTAAADNQFDPGSDADPLSGMTKIPGKN